MSLADRFFWTATILAAGFIALILVAAVVALCILQPLPMLVFAIIFAVCWSLAPKLYERWNL